MTGVEEISERHCARAVQVDGVRGRVLVELDASGHGVVARASASLAPHRAALAALLGRVFDLDAPIPAIRAHLARDPFLAGLVEATPGLRVPGCFDGWELAVRAVLGQQVSVAAATTLCGRLVQAYGERVPGPGARWSFPSPDRLARAKPARVAAIGIPGARAETLVALARAVRAGDLSLAPDAPAPQMVDALQRVRGIGPWTAGYVAIRAFKSPDLFLPGDVAAQRALGVGSARDAERASARWSPFRSYALMHVWRSLASAPRPARGWRPRRRAGTSPR